MKKILSIIAMSTLIGGCVATRNNPAKEVSTQTLLEDMVNREIQSEFPAVPFKTKQFSSYSRKAKSPEDGWFSNWDWSNFLRIEENEGRTEYVMMDHQGPGSIVRFWMTFAKQGYNSTLRIYIDGSATPVLEGKPIDILSGGKVVGAPMSSSSSELTHVNRRGHNLYMPIPYAKSCKVTIEHDKLFGKTNDLGQVDGTCIYYNINYRAYDKGAVVKSFTKEDLKTNAKLIADVNKKLLNPAPEGTLTKVKLSEVIKAGNDTEFGIGAEKAIKSISVKLEAKDLNQALRSTILSIKFDGKETVWVPVGDFFGTGYKISPYKSWYTEVTEDGTMSCSWVMPFENNAKISFINLGEQDVKVNATVGVEDEKWTADSLYFHASWFEKNRVETVAHRGHVGTGAEDVNFVTLKGKGVYVGDSLTLFNCANSWWGEGDEKVYVDGETFPSHFGTGTEDYYGYAWCRPENFYTPFIAQPDGAGNLRSGFSVNSRYRLLDQIPFTKSLKFDMELWHWKKTVMNYAPAVFYYATADTESNAIKDVKNAKEKVILSKSQIFPPLPPIVKNGKIEGESMIIESVSKGKAEEQELGGAWSRGAHAWWSNGSEGGELILKFKSDKELTGKMDITYTVANDYGTFDIFLNGKQIESGLDLYSERLNLKTQSYENSVIKKGDNELKVILKGVNPASKPAKMFGLDVLEIK